MNEIKKKKLLDIYINGFYDEYFNKFEDNSGDLVKVFVDLSYDDTKRVLHGVGEIKEDREKILEDIVSEIKSMNKDFDSQDEFDDFHHKLCEIWTNGFNEKPELGQYGKAQKIVNMSLKYYYTYCYHHSIKNMIYKFQYCHFTLDSYTLKWLNSCTGVDGKPKFLNSNTTWSNLNYKEYESIQKYAKDCLKKSFKEMWPIQAEFIIWKGVMLHDILKTWISVRDNYPDKDALNKVIDSISSKNLTSLQNTIDLLAGCKNEG